MTRRTAILAAALLGGLPKLQAAPPALPAKKPTWWMDGTTLNAVELEKCPVTGDHGFKVIFRQKCQPGLHFDTMSFHIREWMRPDATPLEVADHLRRLANSIEKF